MGLVYDEVIEVASGGAVVTPATPPVAGHLLVLSAHTRGTAEPSSISGWTRIGDVIATGGAPIVRHHAMFYRVAQTGDASWFMDADQTVFSYSEWSGYGALLAYSAGSATGTAVTTAGGPITPVSSDPVLVIGGVTWALENDTAVISTAPTGSTTEIDDGYPVTFGNNPGYFTGYIESVTPPSGAYTVSGTATHTGIAPSWVGITAVFGAAVADPAPGVWIDWDRDGFDTGSTDTTTDPLLTRLMPQSTSAGISDNVTTYTKSFTWDRGGSYDHVGSDGPGGATILLKNMDGRFDPDNTASPVYGKMVPGLPVWIGAEKTTGSLTSGSTIRGVFGGYVREFNPTVRNGERVCEVICEDSFGRWVKTPVTVEPSLTRSHGELREAILDAIGEDALYRSLEAEAGNLPISAVDSENALAVLEELNTSTASRHFVAPADTKEGWYTYAVVNREHALADAVSETWDGDNIKDVSGWRVTNDNVIEQQRASISPVTITSNNDPVWVYDGVPFTVTQNRRRTIIAAEFEDYVFDATLDANVSSGSISTSLTNYGKTAKIEIWAASIGGATVSKLQILGRQVVRGDAEQVIAGSSDPGVRAGSVISSDYIGTPAMAQGICDFIVWKFGQALKRPSMTIVGKNTTTLATIFERDIYDVVGVVIDKLSVTSKRLEIIGLAGSCDIGVGPAKWSVTYELQETPNQAAVHYFTVGTDTVGGGVPVAPF